MSGRNEEAPRLADALESLVRTAYPATRFRLDSGFAPYDDGTYELCGPKVQGNPEGLPSHTLIRHGEMTIGGAPLTFDGIRDFLATQNIEGIVWHHPDGRMVKIKTKDFGLRRTPTDG